MLKINNYAWHALRTKALLKQCSAWIIQLFFRQDIDNVLKIYLHSLSNVHFYFYQDKDNVINVFYLDTLTYIFFFLKMSKKQIYIIIILDKCYYDFLTNNCNKKI